MKASAGGRRSWRSCKSGSRNKTSAMKGAINGSAPAAPRRSAPMATTPRACASARKRAATGAPSRSGTSASTRIWTVMWKSAPATSRLRSGVCAALPVRAWQTSWISTTPSNPPPMPAILTSSCRPSGATTSRCCCFSMSAAPWTPISSCARRCSVPRAPSSRTWSISISTTACMRACGRTMPAATPTKCQPGTCCTNTRMTIKSFSSVTRP